MVPRVSELVGLLSSPSLAQSKCCSDLCQLALVHRVENAGLQKQCYELVVRSVLVGKLLYFFCAARVGLNTSTVQS